MVDTLIDGVGKFRRSYFKKNRAKFLDLVENGQRPHTLFIGCADSRVLPHAITHTDPGELFVMRNVGNMVPSRDAPADCASTGSVIEYAVSVLGVSDIVVCGHSHCGACAALLQDQDDPELALTRRWLGQGQRVRELVLSQASRPYDPQQLEIASREEREELLRATEKAMVVQHLANLRTYPAVARRIADGSLAVHGWHYTIESGTIEAYDPRALAFLRLDRDFQLHPGHDSNAGPLRQAS